VSIVAVGVSIDNLSCVVFASPTKLLHKYLQGVGRGTRIYEGKVDLLVIDHCGIVLSLGLAEDKQHWSLDGKDTPEELKKKANEDAKAPKEIKCVKCSAIFKSRRFCPACGHEMITPGQRIPHHEAEMKELIKVEKPKPIDKEKFYSELLGYAQEQGKTSSFALAIFRARYNSWPHHKHKIQPTAASPETLGYIKYTRIKWNKGKGQVA